MIAEAIAGGYSALALALSCNSLFSRLVLMMDMVTKLGKLRRRILLIKYMNLRVILL